MREAILPKSGTGGNMGGGLGNFCDVNNSAKIGHRFSRDSGLGNFFDGSNFAKIGYQ